MSHFINHERELMAYFNVGIGEFMKFWGSLSPRERLYYRHARLS
ncbi:hypothetical protein SEA_LIBERTYBELL_61 [Streptomyces phage LibertyBell]|nr:hypothetical protein SEA_LIBERTYBELL_61 [Streptomyces phage LibertyBell]